MRIFTYPDEFHVTAASLIRNTSQMRISLLTVLSNNLAVVKLVLSQEPFRVVVTIDVDLSKSVVSGRLVNSLVYATL